MTGAVGKRLTPPLCKSGDPGSTPRSASIPCMSCREPLLVVKRSVYVTDYHCQRCGRSWSERATKG